MTATFRGARPTAATTVDVAACFSKNVFNHVACAWYLLGDSALTLRGTPATEDRRRAVGLARSAGLEVEESAHVVTVRGTPRPTRLSDSACQSRISICQAVALAAGTGWAALRVGGGCSFADRPIDLHLQVVRAAGGTVEAVSSTELLLSFPETPRGVQLDVRANGRTSSVGASASALLVASMADSPSEIVGINTGPEVSELAAVLRILGAGIVLDGDRAQVIGRSTRTGGSHTRHLPLDEIAVGTYALMGLARTGHVVLRGGAGTRFSPGFLSALADAGVTWLTDGDDLLLRVDGEAPRPTSVTTSPYPGFPTDLAPAWSAFMALADGESTITETVYRRRNSHLGGLVSAGVLVRQDSPATYRVSGPSRIDHRPVLDVSDIRCGDAFMVMAASSDAGAVLVDAEGHLPRGHSFPGALLSTFGSELRSAVRVP